MEAGGKGSKCIEWGVAAVLFGLIVFLCQVPALVSKAGRGDTPQRVLLGDSIYAEGGEEAVTELLGRKTGMPVWNAAMGGTSLSRVDQARWMDLTVDSMSLAALSKSILSGDFAVQRQAGIRTPATEYFGQVIEDVSGWDFSRVQILFLGYGMNDYQNGVPLDDEENAWNEYSFGGALRRVLTDLKKAYPDMRMILLTPTYSWYLAQGETCEERNWGGGYMEAYVEKEKEIAREYGVEVLDLYHDFYQHDTFEDWKIATRDGVHPNEKGREMIAERIATYLEEHP